MTKYRKKSIIFVDAWQFTKKNFRKGAPEFIRHAPNDTVVLYSQYAGNVIYGEINTPNGTMLISENDYIVKGIEGDFYPCKPDYFEVNYEKVEAKKSARLFSRLFKRGSNDD